MNQKIAKILEEKRYCRINDNWLQSCIQFLQKFSHLSPEMMAEKVFEQIANCDLKLCSKGSLPSPAKDLNKINGTHLFQIEDLINIGENYETRDSESRGRCMKVNLTDGINDIWAFEYQRIPQFSVNLPPGTKIEISNATVKRGMILLTPQNTRVVGGTVQDMIEAWQKRKESASKQHDSSVPANNNGNTNPNVNNRNSNNINNSHNTNNSNSIVTNNTASNNKKDNNINNANNKLGISSDKPKQNGIVSANNNFNHNTNIKTNFNNNTLNKINEKESEKSGKMEEDPPMDASKDRIDPISLVSDGEDSYLDAYDYGDFDGLEEENGNELMDDSFMDLDNPQLAPYTYLSQVAEELKLKANNFDKNNLYDPTAPSKFVKVKAAITNLVKPFQYQKGKYSLDVEIDDGHSKKMLVTLSDPVIERIIGMSCAEFKKNLGDPITKAHNLNKLKDMEKEMARMEGIFSLEVTIGSKPMVNDISDPTLEEIRNFCNFLEGEESKRKRDEGIKEERDTKKMKINEEDDFDW